MRPFFRETLSKILAIALLPFAMAVILFVFRTKMLCNFADLPFARYSHIVNLKQIYVNGS